MYQNRLISETSPYLLQHAHNPVDWYPWCDDALKRAVSENKPIFLSVGYSACHWCHVMEHESFENEEIAKIMNDNFVCIKVDREERPDIDDIYQKACQMATGQGGWPLSVFLTPDKKPFYAGTYFPVLDSYGRPGFGSILLQLAQAWREKPEDVKKAAEGFMETLRKADVVSVPAALEKTILDEGAVNLLSIADNAYGGFGNAPKFPNAANLSFLLRYGKISKVTKFNEFVLRTLTRMAKGGIFDQIGGGFHRYSTDARWLVPHFEKMLYDNALLPIVYAEAYQQTKDPLYLEVIRKTLGFVLREMRSDEGGFYSALDADSEGEEGKYYVWKKKEIQDVLGNDADAFCMYYDVTDGGNFEGHTILNNSINISTVAFQCGMTVDRIRQIVSAGEKKLLEVRAGRVRPGLDDKVLTSWNALMISSLARCYRVTDDMLYLEAAERCVDFVERNLMRNGVLLRTYKGGQAKLRGYLEDYAYFINSLVDVFEVNPEARYLDLAQRLAEYMIAHFWDGEHSSFYFTADDHERLIIRPKNNYDLSMPSGNSVAAGALLRLYHLTLQKEFLEVATKIMISFGTLAAENPFGFGHLLNTIYMYLHGPIEITFLGTRNKEMYDCVTKKFLPECILVNVKSKEQLSGLSNRAFFAGKQFEDRDVVFVCKNFSCSRPLLTVSDVEALL